MDGRHYKTKTKDRAELIDERRYRGALVRARADDSAAGEAPTKQTLGLEKIRAERNHIEAIEYGGNLTTDIKDNIEAFNVYYWALFGRHNVDTASFKDEYLKYLLQMTKYKSDWNGKYL